MKRKWSKNKIGTEGFSFRQKLLYEFIIGYTLKNGFQPNFSEMQDFMTVSSQRSISHMLGVLERKGYIKRGGSGRDIVIPELQRMLKKVNRAKEAIEYEKEKKEKANE